MAQDLVQRWLNGRQTIIVELVGLTREVRSSAPSGEALQQRLKGFCADLVDYVSAGHFEIYSRLVATNDAARLFARLGTQLQRTTDQVLAFNDAIARKRPDLSRLRAMLAEVGLALEARLAIEDQLVSAARVSVTSRISQPSHVLAASV